MAKTLPIARSGLNRLAQRVSDVQPMFEWRSSWSDTLCSAFIPVPCGAIALFTSPDLTCKVGSASYETLDAVFLVARGVSPVEVFVEVKASRIPEYHATDSTIDSGQLERIVRGQSGATGETGWAEFTEPLWDPLKWEVGLLVKEYFAQADAHSD